MTINSNNVSTSTNGVNLIENPSAQNREQLTNAHQIGSFAINILNNPVNHTPKSSLNNPDRGEYPSSDEALSDITYMDIEDTKIQQETRESILALSKNLRDKEVSNVLPIRLEEWKRFAQGNENRNYDLDFINQFDEEKKKTINEWLLRLSKTRDFHKDNSKLAHIACSMLETLKDNEEFKELFFVQVEVNNEECQDRAAMALNEIYSCWRLHTVNPMDSQENQLKLFTAIAKTNALRIALSKAFAKKNLRESAENYLYYETLLKDELRLVSPINEMAYDKLGKCDFIDINVLKKEVENTYMKILGEFPGFVRLALLDSSYSMELEKLEKMNEEYQAILEYLIVSQENSRNHLNEQYYKERLTLLKDDREKLISLINQDWVNRHLHQ